MKNVTYRNNPNWTTEQLIDMSESMGRAYGLGHVQGKSHKKADTWTTEKLVNMSDRLGRAYGLGL